MPVVAIDPGTANTGLVYMDERRVICAKTLAHRKAVRDDQYALMRRAREIAAQVAAWAADKPHEAVVIEGFVGFSGRQGGYTYQTPYLCGYLHRALEGERIVIQTSRQVLNPRRAGSMARTMAALKAGEEPMPGAGMLTNEHLRSAACHGAYYYQEKERKEQS